MKKVSVIAVAVIFILSVVAVGFLGMAMHIYNPISYVTSIEWINREQVLDTIAATIPGLGDYKESKDTEDNYTYPLKHRYKDEVPDSALPGDEKIIIMGADLAGDKKLTLNFKCQGIPANATDTTLRYHVSESPTNQYSFSEGDNNSFNLVIEEYCQVTLNVSSTDGQNVKYGITLFFTANPFG